MSTLAVFAIVSNASAGDPADEVPVNPAAVVKVRPHLRHVSADNLKQLYLECDRASMQGILDLASASECSMLHEEVRERVFSGSFDALLTWWRGARDLSRIKVAPEGSRP